MFDSRRVHQRCRELRLAGCEDESGTAGDLDRVRLVAGKCSSLASTRLTLQHSVTHDMH